MRWTLVMLVLAGCVNAIGAPPVGVEFTPPAEYREMWKATEKCSGLTGDFDRLHFYRAPDGGLGEKITGRWDYPHNISLAAFYVDTQNHTTIQHEMLHDLTQSGDHTAVFYRCGLMV